MKDYENEYWEAQQHIDMLEGIIKAAEAVLAGECCACDCESEDDLES